MLISSFWSVETDGRLPTGQTLADAVAEVDGATESAPVYYMINCAHPTHFDHVLDDAPWMKRVRGSKWAEDLVSCAAGRTN